MSKLQLWAQSYTKKGLADTVDEILLARERLRSEVDQLRHDLTKMEQLACRLETERDDLRQTLDKASEQLEIMAPQISSWLRYATQCRDMLIRLAKREPVPWPELETLINNPPAAPIS